MSEQHPGYGHAAQVSKQHLGCLQAGCRNNTLPSPFDAVETTASLSQYSVVETTPEYNVAPAVETTAGALQPAVETTAV